MRPGEGKGRTCKYDTCRTRPTFMGCTRYTLAGEHKRRAVKIKCFEFPSCDFICFCQKVRVTNTEGVETFKIMVEFSCDRVCYLNNTRLTTNGSKNVSLVLFCVHYTRGAHTPGARSPRRLNFVRWILMFVGPQYGSCFIINF